MKRVIHKWIALGEFEPLEEPYISISKLSQHFFIFLNHFHLLKLASQTSKYIRSGIIAIRFFTHRFQISHFLIFFFS
jgi:hypothetical protein